MSCVLAIDVMGGDHGPSITLPACHLFLTKTSDIVCHLFGDAHKIQPWIKTLSPSLQERVHLFHCPESIDNFVSPKDAVRKFKQSSMRLAIESVQKGQAQAIISAGNTGALMALSKILLSMLPGIERPAIAKALPNLSLEKKEAFTVMLDLGANTTCSPKNLFDFSILGLALHESLTEYQKKPSIKLLNIGSEHTKGNDLIQETAILLTQETQLPYTGFIEADSLFTGACDIVVCDGFTGNIALKTSEGLARLIIQRLKAALKGSLSSQIGAFLLKDELKKKLAILNPAHHNGAFILGLNGIVIKSHGGATQEGFYTALDFAAQQASSDILKKIRTSLKNLNQ